MKRLFKIMTAITVNLITLKSVIACNNEKDNAVIPSITNNLNEQVDKDLSLIDNNGKSLVTAIIIMAFNKMEWDINHEVKNINASQLLDNNQKAKSLASENFLINTLKINKNDDGSFSNEVYNITVLITDIKPIFAKNKNNSDYEITGGNFKLQFVNKNIVEKFGDKYTIPLAINHQGLINPKISFNLNADNFKPIPGFKYNESNQKPENNTDLYQYLNLRNYDSTYIIDNLNWLNNLIDKKDLITIKVTGREINPVQKNWILGNKLFFKIYFGSIPSKEYQLTIKP